MAKNPLKRARVLSESPAHNARPNDILEADAFVIDALAAAGLVDAEPDAVGWCLSQRARVVTIDDPVGAVEIAAAASEGSAAALEAVTAAAASGESLP